jgi:hypothetical protein
MRDLDAALDEVSNPRARSGADVTPQQRESDRTMPLPANALQTTTPDLPPAARPRVAFNDTTDPTASPVSEEKTVLSPRKSGAKPAVVAGRAPLTPWFGLLAAALVVGALLAWLVTR